MIADFDINLLLLRVCVERERGVINPGVNKRSVTFVYLGTKFKKNTQKRRKRPYQIKNNKRFYLIFLFLVSFV